MEEFQDEERLDFVGDGGEEEEVVLDDGEEDDRWGGRREMNDTRSR
jgi:hypothetical protein